MIAGAVVELSNDALGLRIRKDTDQTGSFVFPALAPGEYRVSASHASFQRVEKPVTVTVAAGVTCDFNLPLATAAASVEVSDSAVMVNRESSAVATLFTREFVQNMPLNGRSFQSLVELTPGTVLAPSSITSQGQFAINGQRTSANYFMVDGAGANVGASASATFTQQASGTLPGLSILGTSTSLVSVDALQEFRVVTSTYAAEYGRSPGGQILLTTRSGNNRYTGSLYEYFRNEKLDANDWFANRNSVARLPLRNNDFGGTLGGPVFIPGVYRGKDRTFFFASYEELRLRQPQGAIRSSLVPSAEARQRANPAARQVFDAFPLPNAPLVAGDPTDGTVGRYLSGVSNPSEMSAFSLRLDHRIGSALQLFTRYNRAPSSSASRAFANQDNLNAIDFTTVTAGATWTATPRLVSDLRVNWTKGSGAFNFITREIDGARLPPDSLLFGPNVPRETSSVTLNILSGSAPVSASQGRTLGNDQQQWNVLESVTWAHGGHTWKFGFDYRLLLPEVKARSVSVTHAFGTRTSNGVADLLETGRVNTSIQALAPVSGFRIHNFSGFAQDAWRVARRVTLNYGLRWEWNPAPSGERLPYRLDQIDNLLTATLAPANTELYRTSRRNFAPRGGVAIQLNRSGDLVLRAGSGLFYDVGSGQALQGYTSYPFNSSANLTGVAWPVPVEQIVPAPFNQNPPYATTFRVMDPNLRLPRTVQWSVAIEKAVGANVATATYVGSRGYSLLRTEVLRNQAATGQPVVPVINPALFANNASVFLTRNTGSSDYHSLQLQLQRRMTRGIQTTLAYTWSKAIDNVSDEAAAGLPASGVGPYNLELDRDYAPASFDIRQVFTGAVTWESQRLRGNRTWAAIGSGWGIDAILRLRTGFPFHVVSSTVDPLNFGSTRRADYFGGPNWIDDTNVAAGQRLNTATFRNPAAGRQGTLGRNALRGFGAQQLDLAARRSFRLTERLSLQFRAELFNLFNHPNFGVPNSSLNPVPDAFFGQATQMLGRSLGGGGTSGGLGPLYQVGGPRSAQLSLRLVF